MSDSPATEANVGPRRRRPVFLVLGILISLIAVSLGSLSCRTALGNSPLALELKLRIGIDPNSQCIGTPLLVAAIDSGRKDSAAILINYGASVRTRGEDRRSPWHAALLHPDDEFVILLADQPDEPDFSWFDDTPALIRNMSEKGLLEGRLPFLVSGRAMFDAPGSDGVSPLTLAVKERDFGAAQLLLEWGASPDTFQLEDWISLLDPEWEAVRRVIFSAGIPESIAEAWLIEAVIAQDAETAENILQQHGSYLFSGSGDSHALALAIVNGMSGIAVEMLAYGANPNALFERDLTPVDLAEVMLDSEVLKDLRNREPTPDPTVLRQVRFGLLGPESAGLLDTKWDGQELTKKVVEFQTKHGLPAHGHPSQSLLAAIEEMLSGPFITAASTGDLDYLRMAKEHFPTLTQYTDKMEWDALFHASFSAHPDVVEFLLRSGSDPERLDLQGSNALLIATLGQASAERQRTTIEHLMSRVMSGPRFLNHDGASAYKVAKVRGGVLADALRIPKQHASGPIHVAVLGRPRLGSDRHACSWLFPTPFVKSEWDSGKEIVQIMKAGSSWCVVMGSRVANPGNDLYKGGIRDLSALRSEHQKHGTGDPPRTILGVVQPFSGEPLLAYFGNSVTGYDQIRIARRGLLAEARDIWGKEASHITQLAIINSDLMIVFGTQAGFTSQTVWTTDLPKIIEEAGNQAKQGRLITSLLQLNNKWNVVYSGGTGFKDQRILVASSQQELDQKIEQARGQGWSLRLLAAGTL